MHDIIQFQGIIKNKKEKKNVLIRVMVTESFGYLLIYLPIYLFI